MTAIDIPLLAQMVAAALAAVILALAALAFVPGRLFARQDRMVLEDSRNEAVFIFDGETLIDCSAEGRAILAARPGRGAVGHLRTRLSLAAS